MVGNSSLSLGFGVPSFRVAEFGALTSLPLATGIALDWVVP